MTAPPLGIIGVGLLGTALAARCRAQGLAVCGYDPDPQRAAALVELGGAACGSAEDVFARVETVLLCLPTADVVDAVLADSQAALRPGLHLIDATTGDPAAAERRGPALAARGVRYVDATVVGSSAEAQRGEVVLLVGGEPEAVAECQPLFERIARQAFYLGPWGSGARMKLVVNLVLGLNRAVLAEGLAFAARCGFDPAQALAVLQSGAAASRVMETKGAKMVQHDFTPQARLTQHLKDVELILALGEQVAAHLPLSTLHRELLARVVAAGHGGDDNSAILRAFEA